ncbi:MAG TPA: hypothetical protein P5286_10835, partial [Treponemataceae bacterium]|nr:hypothetical protein [Treponemataceae bacterium]
MNRLNNNNRFGRLIGSYLQLHLNSIILLGSTLLLLGIASYFSTIEVNGLRQLTLSDFEVGRVADRDVVASRELSYVDEDATRIRIEARKKLVPAIFRYDTAISISMLEQFTACSDFLEELYRKEPVKQQFILEFQQEYPGLFDQESLARLHALKDRSTVIKTARNVFRQLVSEGIADFPDEGMEEFNAGEIEIIYTRNGRDESSIVSRNTVILRDALESRVEDTMNYMPSRNVSVSSVMLILDPFIRENILFQRDESERKMEAELRQVQPV